MAYIKKKSERKFKITVCNGYKVNGQKRMKAQTITVPSSVPKRGIQQYVMAEAERIEKKFKYGVEESDQTHFEQYAENWLKRQKPFFKATTYAGYKRNLDIVYPLIGGTPLAKLLPMTLEEMCEELRKRPGRGGTCIKETTVQKYLETVSSVLEDAKKNDIIPFNPAHRVRKKHFEKEVQHIPQKYEMGKLMRAIQNEPILYRAYYTLAITTGLRRGELCALQWRDITGACELTVRRSRSCASGQIVESDTKSHRERIVTIPLGIWELLMALRQQQVLHSGVPDREQPIFTDPDGHVPHPDSFTRHLRKLYKKCGLPEEYHLYYCYQLGILPKKQQPRINRPELERIWKDTEKILAEHAFVHDHQFPSLQAIVDYRKGLSQQVETLHAQRAEIVKQMRRKDAPPELADRRAMLTCKIAELRKEDKIAEGAIKRIQRTRESNRIDQENRNQHTNNKTRSRDRSRQR